MKQTWLCTTLNTGCSYHTDLIKQQTRRMFLFSPKLWRLFRAVANKIDSYGLAQPRITASDWEVSRPSRAKTARKWGSKKHSCCFAKWLFTGIGASRRRCLDSIRILKLVLAEDSV